MNLRRFASLALATTVVLGAATGCSLIAPQATTIPYSAAEGVNVPDSAGPVLIRNVMLVADDEGDRANFLAAFINDTSEVQNLTIEIDGQRASAAMPPRTSISLGFDGISPLLIEGLGAKPGSTVDVIFQSGAAEPVIQAVPVLDGQLPYLSDFVPAG